MDIFWNEDDLTKEEKDYYNKYHLSFIQQTANVLSQKNFSIDRYKREKCYKCNNFSFFKDYKIILYQKNFNNDDKDKRQFKIICPRCKNELEQSKISEELIVFLYIDYIIN